MSELTTKNMPEPETDEMVALWARAHMNEFLPDEWQRKSAVPGRIFNIARAEALAKARQSLAEHDKRIRREALTATDEELAVMEAAFDDSINDREDDGIGAMGIAMKALEKSRERES